MYFVFTVKETKRREKIMLHNSQSYLTRWTFWKWTLGTLPLHGGAFFIMQNNSSINPHEYRIWFDERGRKGNAYIYFNFIYSSLSLFLSFCDFQARCNREKPPCKYYHPPQHLKDQLLINGRNHLALKNALMQQMGMPPNGQIITNQIQQMVSWMRNWIFQLRHTHTCVCEFNLEILNWIFFHECN